MLNKFQSTCVRSRLLIGLLTLAASTTVGAQARLPDWFTGTVIIDDPRVERGVHRPSLIDNMVTVDCRQANTNVRIFDNVKENEVVVFLNDLRYVFQTRSLQGFDISLCGRSNSVRYQVDGEPVLNRARRFDIHGGDGFDYVNLDFANAVGTRALRVEKPPTVNLDLGALSDQVQIFVRDFPAGRFDVYAELGSGNDGFSIVSYGGSVHGSLSLEVDAGMGDDLVDINLTNFRDPYDIPVGSSFYITVWGDEPGVLGVRDNVPDHGQDLLVVRWQGRVDGGLTSRVYGDDQQFRIRDLCGNNCIFRDGAGCPPSLLPGREREGPCDLEDALRNVPGYAGDSVQTRYAMDEYSAGSVELYTDGGLGNDEVVMIFKPDTNVHRLQQMRAVLTGGQNYPGQYDTCWFDGQGIIAEQCSVIDSEISVVD